MKKITLNRPKERFNKNCTYQILVGHKHLTDLKNGEEKTIEIPDELKNEALSAKIQWCGSEIMELRRLNENEKIIVSGNEFLNKKMPLFGAMFPIIGLMLFNLELVPKSMAIGIFVLFLIGIMGTITVWKNKWLNIQTE